MEYSSVYVLVSSRGPFHQGTSIDVLTRYSVYVSVAAGAVVTKGVIPQHEQAEEYAAALEKALGYVGVVLQRSEWSREMAAETAPKSS